MFSIRLATSVACAAIAAGIAAPAYAEAALDDASGDIIVTGEVDGYRTISSTSGTKTDTVLIDVPQSISVVTAEQIADQQIRSVADLVRLTPGLTSGQGEGHRDQINFRGNNSTADFFVDGLRDDVQYFRSFYNLDRVEVHKGPNAMVFGRGGGGGLINRITKGPLAGETRIAGDLSIDSFAAAYGALDLNLPLGTEGGFRLNGFVEHLDNHRDAFDGERWAVNPVVGAEVAPGVSLQLSYEYVHDERVIDRGVPAAFAGTLARPAGPVRGFRDTFFGDEDVNRTNFEAHVVSFRGRAELGGGLTLSTQALYGDYDKVYTNIFPATAVRTATSGPLAGQQVIGIEAYADPTQRETLIGQANIEWRGDTGGIGHVLLLGAEYTSQDTDNARINGFWNPAVLTSAGRRTDIAFNRAPVIPPVTFVAGPTGNSNRAVRSELEQVSLYLQDQISLSDAVDVVAGIRYDRFDLSVTNRFTGTTASRTDDLWSPRLGLVVKPVANASLYVSWTRSYLPQSGDQFLSLDATAATLEPEQFDNYEVGAKWDILPSLSATVAVFRLDRSNTRATGPTPGTVVLTGEQRSSGVELGLVGQVTPVWQVALGYAMIDGEIRATTSAAPAGRRLAQLPEHQLSLWNRFDVTDRLGLGVGVYHQSSSRATISGVTRLPAYTRVDAAVFFKVAEGIDAQVNVENLLGERYFPFAHNDNNVTPGAPTNARLTVRFAF
jgi:catecholate siderophore receptor